MRQPMPAGQEDLRRFHKAECFRHTHSTRAADNILDPHRRLARYITIHQTVAAEAALHLPTHAIQLDR